jgi:hypothetical protein
MAQALIDAAGLIGDPAAYAKRANAPFFPQIFISAFAGEQITGPNMNLRGF